LAFGWISQNVVRLGDCPELDRIALPIRMVLPNQLPVRRFDFRL